MAKEILTAERVREVLDYNPDTGEFFRKVRLAQRHQVGDRADTPIKSGNAKGYKRVAVDSKRFLAHRVAWLYVHGEWPKKFIDHINGDKGDNRIENLRDVPARTNLENKTNARRDNKSSGLLGVKRANQKWRAGIQTKGQQIHVGVFDTPEEAHEAYVVAKRIYHQGCTI